MSLGDHAARRLAAARILPLEIFGLVAGAVTVRGSFVGTHKDMAECLDFAAKGKVKADIELAPLSAINTIFERLEHGDVPARVVLPRQLAAVTSLDTR